MLTAEKNRSEETVYKIRVVLFTTERYILNHFIEDCRLEGNKICSEKSLGAEGIFTEFIIETALGRLVLPIGGEISLIQEKELI